MSNIFKKLVKKLALKRKMRKAVAGIATMSLVLSICAPSIASADTTVVNNTVYPQFNMFNTNEINEGTETVKMAISQPGAAWSDNVGGVQAGQEVAFYMYYHNGREVHVIVNGEEVSTTPTIAYNTRLKLDLPQAAVTPVGGFATLPVTGYVWAQNSLNVPPYTAHNPEGAKYATDFGNLTVNTNVPVKLSFVPGSMKWFPELKTGATPVARALNNGQNGSEVLTDAGLGVGDIHSCWDYKGVITFKAKVVAVPQNPALTITKTVNKATADQGDVLTYTIKAKNTGVGVAHDVVLADYVPTYLENITNINPASGNYLALNDTIAWNYSTLDPGQEVTATFNATVKTGLPEGTTHILNRASVAATGLDAVFAQANTDVTVIVTKTANLHIKKYVSENGTTWYNYNEDNQTLHSTPGKQLTYKILVWNNGNADATNVVVKDDVTAGNNGYYINIGPFDTEYGTVSATTNRTEATAVSHTFNVTVNPSNFKAGNTTVTNTAHIDGNDQHVNIGDTSSTRTIIEAAATLRVDITVDKTEAYPKDALYYEVHYGNMGNGIAENTKLVVNLPEHFDYTLGSASNSAVYSATNNTLTWNIGSLAVGATDELVNFRGKVAENAQNGDILTAEAVLSASNAGTVRDAVTTNVIVVTPHDVVISKSKSAWNVTQKKDATTTIARPGDIIRYVLSTENIGDAVAENYVVKDGIADVLEYANIIEMSAGGKVVNNPGATNSVETKMVEFPGRDIAVNQKIAHYITIQVLSKLPNKQPNGMHYDGVMYNKYGNALNIKVKALVIIPDRLPQSGAGFWNWSLAGVAFSISLFFVVAFSYIRERMALGKALQKEIVWAK